ncbi:MAG: DUF6056 family protein [Lachnospiraceae bacterium]|nr:DUF6056 family protein [Lachnospiraceae bacterium]
MNKKKAIDDKMKKSRTIFLGVCIWGVFLTILAYNVLTPYLSDDFFYKSNVGEAHNFFELIKQQYQEYLSNSGRVIGQFSIRLSLAGDKMIFNVINSIMFVLLSLLIYWNVKGRKQYDIPLYLLIVLALWRYSVNFGETILWICGACNYLWGSVIILGLVTLYRCVMERAEIKHRALVSAGLFFYGVIAGWCNENTSGGGLLLIMLFTVIEYVERKRQTGLKIKDFVNSCIIAPHLGMMCGLLGMVLSPGVYKRMAVMNTTENYSGFVGYLSRLYKCFMEMDHLFLELFILLGVVIIFAVICERKSKMVINTVLPFVIASAATSLVLVALPTPQNRAYFGAGIFLIIACIQGFHITFHDRSQNKGFKAAYYCAIWILSVSFFFVYVENLVNLARIYRENNERIELIREAAEKGEDFVVIPQYREAFKNRFTFAYDSDMTEDAGYWINQYYEVYYGVASISALPRDEWEELFGE